MNLGSDLRYDLHQVIAQHTLKILDLDSTTIESQHTYMLEANRPTRFFERVFTWTGSGLEKDPLVTSGLDKSGYRHHRLHGPVIRSGHNRLFLIDLGRTLDKGEKEIVEFSQFFVDAEGSFQPKIAHTVAEPCEQIDLCVHLPIRNEWQVFSCTSHAGLERANSRESLIGEPEGSEFIRFRFVVNNPEPGHTYRVEWSQ